MSEKQTQPE